MTADDDAYDWTKIEEVALSLLSLTLHDGDRAWKGLDWDLMERLHARGWITDPRGRAKSVVFTEEGLQQARQLFEWHFARARGR
jgi:hypothetical protein